MSEGLAKLAAGPGNVGLAERPERERRARLGRAATSQAAGVCGTDLHIEARRVPERAAGDDGPRGLRRRRRRSARASTAAGRARAWSARRTTRPAARCALLPRRAAEPVRAAPVDRHARRRRASRRGCSCPARSLHRVPDGARATPARRWRSRWRASAKSLLDPPVIGAGDRVLVIGPGAIGLLAAQVARAGGGARDACAGRRARRARGSRSPRELGFATRRRPGEAPAGGARRRRRVLGQPARGSPHGARGRAPRRARSSRSACAARRSTVAVGPDLLPRADGHERASPRPRRRGGARWRCSRPARSALGPLVSDVVPLARWREAFDDLARRPGGEGGASAELDVEGDLERVAVGRVARLA